MPIDSAPDQPSSGGPRVFMYCDAGMVAIAPPTTQQVTGSVASDGAGRERQAGQAVDRDQGGIVGEQHRLASGQQADVAAGIAYGTVHIYSSRRERNSRTNDAAMTKIRGALSQIQGRFESEARAPFDDGWANEELETPPLPTTVTEERARSIIARNDSPDVPFEQSINAYRGCEHGCIYCYARPSHAYLELSPGLDFETRLFAKTNAVELLKEELSKRGYRPTPMAFGTNTDCYQPIERRYKLMRGLLQVLADCDHPLTIVTKSALIERDIDLLAPMAKKNLVKAFLSITTLDHRLARTLEPRAASPQRRVDALRTLAAAQGFPAASWWRR